MFQETPDLVTSIIILVVSIILLITFFSIAAFLKKIRDITYFNFLKVNNIQECQGCYKYYSKDETQCPHCNAQYPKAWPFAKKFEIKD